MNLIASTACLILNMLLLCAGSTNENYTTVFAKEGNVLEGQNLKFLVMSDMHAFTTFSFNTNFREKKVWENGQRVLKLIKEEHGGELVLSPGDSVSYGSMLNNEIADKVGIDRLQMHEAVYTSTFQAFSGLKALYSSLNYTLIAAIGDHEIGGKYLLCRLHPW
jgi:hypothetical protein